MLWRTILLLILLFGMWFFHGWQIQKMAGDIIWSAHREPISYEEYVPPEKGGPHPHPDHPHPEQE